MSDTAYLDKKGATTSNAGFSFSTTSSASKGVLPPVDRAAMKSAPVARDVEGAVYSYIRAVRTLGRTRVTTSEIARALSLNPATVVSVVGKLRNKGVKIAR